MATDMKERRGPDLARVQAAVLKILARGRYYPFRVSKTRGDWYLRPLGGMKEETLLRRLKRRLEEELGEEQPSDLLAGDLDMARRRFHVSGYELSPGGERVYWVSATSWRPSWTRLVRKMQRLGYLGRVGGVLEGTHFGCLTNRGRKRFGLDELAGRP